MSATRLPLVDRPAQSSGSPARERAIAFQECRYHRRDEFDYRLLDAVDLRIGCGIIVEPPV
jgi:hypothetical protein